MSEQRQTAGTTPERHDGPDQDPAFAEMTEALEAVRQAAPRFIETLQALREINYEVAASDPAKSAWYRSSGWYGEDLTVLAGDHDNPTPDQPYSFSQVRIVPGLDTSRRGTAPAREAKSGFRILVDEHTVRPDGTKTLTKVTMALPRKGKLKKGSGGYMTKHSADGELTSDQPVDEKHAEEVALSVVYRMLEKQDAGLPKMTLSLRRLRETDPELIEAIERARRAGSVLPAVNSESIDALDPPADQGRGTSLTLTYLPHAREVEGSDQRPGLIEIGVNEWVEDDRHPDYGETVVTGKLRLTEDGEALPSTSFIYTMTGELGLNQTALLEVPEDAGAGIPARTKVRERHEGAGNPDTIRALAIHAAEEIVRRSQASHTAED